MSRERDNARFSKAIEREIDRKEALMQKCFGIPWEPTQQSGDCLIPEGSTLVLITQELLQFSNN